MIVGSLRSSVENGFDVFFAWLPQVLGFLAILLIGYIVAKVVASLVRRVTHSAGLDRMVHDQIGGSYVQRVIASPSGLLGTIAFWAVWLSAISLAASVLGVDALENLIASIWAYLPNVLAALLIFLVAGAIAGGVVTLVKRTMGDTGLGRIVATAAPILIMAIATFMILDQLKIAEDIVVITYAALIGVLALGSALAFGLGGREVAGEMVRDAYERGRSNKEQWKRDLDRGKGSATTMVEQRRAELDGEQSPPRPRTT